MRSSKIRPVGRPPVGTACLALCGLLLSGCGARSSAPGVRVFAGFDVSGSMHPRLAAAALAGSRLAGRLDPGRDTLTLYRVDRQTEEFQDGPAPDSGAGLQREIVAALRKEPVRPGTFPASFWAETARRAKAETRPVSIILFSDGDNDDQRPEAAQAIRRAAADMAQNPHVTNVSVCGVSPGNRAALRDTFAPLGGRFELLNLSEPDVQRLADQTAP